MKKYKLFLFALFVCTGTISFAQTLPKPDHVVVVIMENHAYEQIIGYSGAPYINGLTTDTDAALFTNSFALSHPSQPNYLMLYSGSAQGITDDAISPNQFTTCNLGAMLIDSGYKFIGYSEDQPSVGYLGATSGAYARKHNPWSNWQGSPSDSIPIKSNAPYTLFPTNFDSLPTVSFVVPNLNDDMHDGTITAGDTWLQNNIDNYVIWSKTHNSLLILTFDEDNDNYNNHITTIFLGQNVKGGSYSDTITHYNVLLTIEAMYGLPECANTNTVKPISKIWKATTTSLSQLSINNSQLSIYPNPVINELTINYNINSHGTIGIFDLLGRKLDEQDLLNNSKSGILQVGELPKGIYELRLTSGNDVLIKKFIKD